VELLAVMVALALLLLVFLAIGKWYPGTGADVLDWQPTRSYEDEIRLEIEDIDEMLEASNERRRRTGRPELTEDQVRLEVEHELMEQQERNRELNDD
jgi:type II secretory pathway component PulJ